MRCTTTRSSRLQQFGLLVCLGLLLAAAGAHRAAAQSVSVTTTSPTPPATIAAVPGLPVSITANAAFTDVPLAANETRVGGTSLSYAWSGSAPFTTSPDGSSATFTPSFGAPGTNKLTLTCTVTYSETINSTDPDSANASGTIVTPTVINGAQVSGSVAVTVVAVNPVVTIGSASAPGGTQDVAVTPSNGAGDLTLTFGANSVVLKQAFIAENDGFAWSRKNNRLGDLTWRTTVPFAAGAPTARATAA